MKQRMIWPLLITAVVIIVRIVLEEAGAPPWVNNILGVHWLLILVPVYFAHSISSSSGDPNPFRALFKHVIVYAVLARFMIMITYSLAFVFQWSAPRFSVAGGGVVGEGVTWIQGLLTRPLTGFAIGTIAAVIIGIIIGSAALALMRRFSSS